MFDHFGLASSTEHNVFKIHHAVACISDSFLSMTHYMDRPHFVNPIVIW